MDTIAAPATRAAAPAPLPGGLYRPLAAKLLRYLIRMSTRPTPYGLFAEVGIARCGAATILRIGPGHLRTSTRPDMAWL